MTAPFLHPFRPTSWFRDRARTSLTIELRVSFGLRVLGMGSLAALVLLVLSACAKEHSNEVKTNAGALTAAAPVARSEPMEIAPATPPTIPLLYPPKPFVWLGVELKARNAGLPGVLIERVLPGSPASLAQLQVGDIVLYLGQTPLNTPQEVSTVVRDERAGSSKPLIIERDGQQRLVRIVFQLMPEFEDRLRLAFVGRPAPEISGVVAFQGEVASLRSLKGQVVILEFWASFCQACRLLGPTLDEWHRSYLSRGAQVVGITVDLPHVGLEVARRAQMGYPLGSDPDAEITRSYMASQIPTLFIIDSRGIVRDAIVGYSEERLSGARALIERLLSEAS